MFVRLLALKKNWLYIFLFALVGLFFIGYGGVGVVETTNGGNGDSGNSPNAIVGLALSSSDFNNGENISLFTTSPALNWDSIAQTGNYLAILTDGQNIFWGKYNLTSTQLPNGDTSTAQTITSSLLQTLYS